MGQIIGLESFCRTMEQAETGDNVGAMINGVTAKEAERGMILSKPGTVVPCNYFKANIYCLTEEEGGRKKPFFQHYQPQFYFRTADCTGSVDFPECQGQKQS